jgi:hypothetical protein
MFLHFWRKGGKKLKRKKERKKEKRKKKKERRKKKKPELELLGIEKKEAWVVERVGVVERLCQQTHGKHKLSLLRFLNLISNKESLRFI